MNRPILHVSPATSGATIIESSLKVLRNAGLNAEADAVKEQAEGRKLSHVHARAIVGRYVQVVGAMGRG